MHDDLPAFAGVVGAGNLYMAVRCRPLRWASVVEPEMNVLMRCGFSRRNARRASRTSS